jgi:hypothetical protein
VTLCVWPFTFVEVNALVVPPPPPPPGPVALVQYDRPKTIRARTAAPATKPEILLLVMLNSPI